MKARAADQRDVENVEAWAAIIDALGHRHWNAVLRLKSLLVQVFVRDVTSNNSSAEAADLLFAHQRFGTDRAACPSIWIYAIA